jgi:hypothetical protein
MRRLKCRVYGTVFGNSRDIRVRSDIDAPAIRVIKLRHDADVNQSGCIAMRKSGFWTRV